MKKYLTLIVILASTSVYASCPIDGFTDSCSIAEFQRARPLQKSYAPAATIKEFSGTPDARLRPSQNDLPSKQLRDFGPQTGDYSYNTSCQFGVCNPSGTPQLFENRGQINSGQD